MANLPCIKLDSGRFMWIQKFYTLIDEAPGMINATKAQKCSHCTGHLSLITLMKFLVFVLIQRDAQQCSDSRKLVVQWFSTRPVALKVLGYNPRWGAKEFSELTFIISLSIA